MKYCKLCGNCGHMVGLCTADPVELKIEVPPETRLVELLTDLDGWKLAEELRPTSTPNVWAIQKTLPPGNHQFKFRLDRLHWVVSNEYPCVTVNGNTNNCIEIHMKLGESVIAQSVEALQGKDPLATSAPYSVQILLNEIALKEIQNRLQDRDDSIPRIEVWGSWNNWKQGSPMVLFNEKNAHLRLYVFKVELPRGTFHYKFKIRGMWVADPFRPIITVDGYPNHWINPEGLVAFSQTGAVSADRRIVGTRVTPEIYSHDNLYDCDLTGHSMTLIDNKLFIFGGLLRDTFTNNMLKISFNPFKVKELKHLGTNAPTPIGFHKAIKYGEKLIIYGGYDSKSVSDQYHTYSTINNTWTAYKFENPIIREMYSVCYKEGTSRIYLFGGLYSHPDDEFEFYFDDIHILFLNLMRFQCVTVRNPPLGRYGHSTVLIDWTAFMFGGCRNEGLKKNCFNDLYRINLFDHDNLEWKLVQPTGPLPEPRYGHCCVAVGLQLVVYGGYSAARLNNLLGDLWLFNIPQNEWVSLEVEGGSKPLQRALAQAAWVDNTLVIFGGKVNKQNDLHDKLIRFHFQLGDVKDRA